MDESMPLTEREKETLRLLLVGHDAKSIANDLGLSVHTVNERLRDARRKLGVSSSREAARRLARLEAGDPKSLADKDLGVVSSGRGGQHEARPDRGRRAGAALAWLGGGMIIMSLIVVAIALSGAFHAGGNPGRSAEAAPALVAALPNAPLSPAATSARAWVALIDRARWDESWDAAGTLFKSKLAKEQWPAIIAPVRTPLGAISTRTVLTDTKTNTLPNVPAGDYEIIQFQTNFAQKPNGVETVILAHETSGWKVDGYFIR
jgi:DNA-binding CsgD family transcriptional regulator